MSRSTRPGDDSLKKLLSLLEKLPEYMIPSAFVLLDALPLTPNGKIDRKALPAPSFEREAEHEYVAPRTPLEESLAAIWENVLEIHPIGVTDDFFELGATSIVAARLFAEIERKLRTKLPLAPVFQAPTIEQLSADRVRNEEQRWTPVPIQPKGRRRRSLRARGAGTVLHLQPLARRLGEDQPFGLQARSLRQGHAATTVEDMAARASRLREVQPEDPYDLAGYCFGGIVAFDMARRLRAEGEDVHMLVMFNAPALPGSARAFSLPRAGRGGRRCEQPHEPLPAGSSACSRAGGRWRTTPITTRGERRGGCAVNRSGSAGSSTVRSRKLYGRSIS
jgi:acyl carrier protein